MKWEVVTLGSIGEFRNGVNFNKENFGLGIKVINVGDFKDYFIPRYMDLGEINPDGIVNENSILKEEDIVFVRSNGNKDLVGRIVYLENLIEPITFSAFCIRCRFNSDDIFPKFFAYLFRSDLIRKSLSNSAGGTNINNLNQTLLSNLKVPLPPFENQKVVSTILSAYDNLIENNLKRIKLLEEAAQNIYKEWFVNFRFPGHEDVEFKDHMPEGWKKVPFINVAEYINGYPFKPNHHSHSGLPIIKIKELKEGVSIDTPMNDGTDVPLKYHFDNESILFSWSADLDAYWWSSGKALLNQHLFLVIPFNLKFKEHFYFSLKLAMPEFRNKTTGATMKHIKRSELASVYYLQPGQNVAQDFCNIVRPLLLQTTNLHTQNQKLKEARDILLPRLMNQTIEVS